MDKNLNQYSHDLWETELYMLNKGITAWCTSQVEPPAFNKRLAHP